MIQQQIFLPKEIIVVKSHGTITLATVNSKKDIENYIVNVFSLDSFTNKTCIIIWALLLNVVDTFSMKKEPIEVNQMQIIGSVQPGDILTNGEQLQVNIQLMSKICFQKVCNAFLFIIVFFCQVYFSQACSTFHLLNPWLKIWKNTGIKVSHSLVIPVQERVSFFLSTDLFNYMLAIFVETLRFILTTSPNYY